VEQGFFHKLAFNNKTLKTLVEFQIDRKRSNVVEFELCQISRYGCRVIFVFIVSGMGYCGHT